MLLSFKPITLAKGEYIFREGEKISHIYIIRKGNFQILKNMFTKSSGVKRAPEMEKVFKKPKIGLMSIYSEGQLVGEECLFETFNSTSYAVKCQDSDNLTFQIKNIEFERKFKGYPEIY